MGLRVQAYTPDVTSEVVVSSRCGLGVVWARRNCVIAATGGMSASAIANHPKRRHGVGIKVSTGQYLLSAHMATANINIHSGGGTRELRIGARSKQRWSAVGIHNCSLMVDGIALIEPHVDPARAKKGDSCEMAKIPGPFGSMLCSRKITETTVRQQILGPCAAEPHCCQGPELRPVSYATETIMRCPSEMTKTNTGRVRTEIGLPPISRTPS